MLPTVTKCCLQLGVSTNWYQRKVHCATFSSFENHIECYHSQGKLLFNTTSIFNCDMWFQIHEISFWPLVLCNFHCLSYWLLYCVWCWSVHCSCSFSSTCIFSLTSSTAYKMTECDSQSTTLSTCKYWKECCPVMKWRILFITNLFKASFGILNDYTAQKYIKCIIFSRTMSVFPYSFVHSLCK